MTIDYTKLSNAHPLFSRLSGQVLWVLMEEHGVSEADIDAFMDHAMQWRESHLTVMHDLLEHPEQYMQITIDTVEGLPQEQHACATCENLRGKVLPASHPDLIAMLPPYSLGCRARARMITKDELPDDAVEIQSSDCPAHNFMCNSGWFLTYPWAKNAS